MAQETMEEQRMALRRALEKLDYADGTTHVAVLDEWRAEVRGTAFDAGFQMASHVQQEHARATLAAFALQLLGKDPGDGEINLGVLGRWVSRTAAPGALHVD